MKMMDEKFIPVTTDFHTKCNINLSSVNKLSIYGMFAQDNMTGSNSTNQDADKMIYSEITKNQSALGLTWNYLYSNNGYLQTTAYLNFNNYKLDTKYDFNKQDLMSESDEQNFSGLKSELFYRFSSSHKLTIGGEFKLFYAKYGKWSGFDTLSNATIIQPYNINWGPETSFKIAGFVNYNFIPLDWLSFNIGLRGSYFGFIRSMALDPRLSANIKLTNELGLNLADGRYSQFPKFYRIFSDVRKKYLKPGVAEHYIAGLDYIINNDMQFKVEVYHKSLSNLAIRVSDTSRVFSSVGTGYSSGLEFNFTKKMSDNFYAICNYTYSLSKRKDIINPGYY